MSSSPASGSVLTARSLGPASNSVSRSLSTPPPLVLCLSQALNKHWKKIFLIFLMFIYIWEREKERLRETVCERGRSRGRGRHRIWLQALSRQHRARCGARTHELFEPWDHDLSRSQRLTWLSHPGTPFRFFFFFFNHKNNTSSLSPCAHVHHTCLKVELPGYRCPHLQLCCTWPYSSAESLCQFRLTPACMGSCCFTSLPILMLSSS